MAKATKNMKVVERVITETVEDGFILELTVEETLVLKKVLGLVGGDPDGPRGKIDSINSALIAAGVKFKNGTSSDWQNQEYSTDGGRIYFK